jgi:galactokinase
VSENEDTGGEQRWSAPGRVNLIGEHLDYNGGPCLPIAIDRHTVVTARQRDDDQVTARSEGEEVSFPLSTEPGDVEGWAAYVAGVVWSMREAGHAVPGLDLDVESDVPRGAGLSSSAALECAVAVCIRDLAGLDVDDITLAVLSQRAENDYVGMPCGILDQAASMCGQEGHAMLLDPGGPSVEQVPAHWSTSGMTLLVIDTKAEHELTDGGYATRREQSEEAARLLGVDWLSQASEDDAAGIQDELLSRRARHVVTETARVHEVVEAMAADDWARVGTLFTASHASLRDDYEVSSPELDVAVEAALGAGALGARMTGAGFGGSAIALLPDEAVDAVQAACADAFERHGFGTPEIFLVAPGRGAGRV